MNGSVHDYTYVGMYLYLSVPYRKPRGIQVEREEQAREKGRGEVK